MRRIFVGDVQGCRAQLEQLLDAVAFRRGEDRLLPVGDLVAKGPDSAGTLALAMALGSEPVLGNHDRAWLRDGKVIDAAQRAWLGAQPYVRVFADVILVHAGLHPAWTEADLQALDDDGKDFATNVRYCDPEGERPLDDWPPPGPPYRPWDDFWNGPKRVVFGHWARRGLVVRSHCVGLDTGCVYGGKLSAWIAEEDRIVQVPGWQQTG